MNFLRRHDLAQGTIFESKKNPSLKKGKKKLLVIISLFIKEMKN